MKMNYTRFLAIAVFSFATLFQSTFCLNEQERILSTLNKEILNENEINTYYDFIIARIDILITKQRMEQYKEMGELDYQRNNEYFQDRFETSVKNIMQNRLNRGQKIFVHEFIPAISAVIDMLYQEYLHIRTTIPASAKPLPTKKPGFWDRTKSLFTTKKR